MQRKKLMDTPMRMTRPDVPGLPEKDQNRRFNLCYDAHVDDSTGEDVLVIDFYLHRFRDERSGVRAGLALREFKAYARHRTI